MRRFAPSCSLACPTRPLLQPRDLPPTATNRNYADDSQMLVLRDPTESRDGRGSAPIVERVDYYKEELEAQKAIGPFFGRSIHVCEDYDGDESLDLELKILEIDEDLGDREEVANAFSQVAATAGAVFPAIQLKPEQRRRKLCGD